MCLSHSKTCVYGRSGTSENCFRTRCRNKSFINEQSKTGETFFSLLNGQRSPKRGNILWTIFLICAGAFNSLSFFPSLFLARQTTKAFIAVCLGSLFSLRHVEIASDRNFSLRNFRIRKTNVNYFYRKRES